MRALLIVFLFAVGLANAVQPVASVSSSSQFEIRGHPVNVDGVPSWPLSAGDDIAAGKESATIQLHDGSRIILLPGSRLRIDSKSSTQDEPAKGANVQIDLLTGSLRMGSVVSPNVSVSVQGNRVKLVGGRVIQVPGSASGGKTALPVVLRPAFPTPVSSR